MNFGLKSTIIFSAGLGGSPPAAQSLVSAILGDRGRFVGVTLVAVNAGSQAIFVLYAKHTIGAPFFTELITADVTGAGVLQKTQSVWTGLRGHKDSLYPGSVVADSRQGFFPFAPLGNFNNELATDKGTLAWSFVLAGLSYAIVWYTEDFPPNNSGEHA